jgi:hypothetical protein
LPKIEKELKNLLHIYEQNEGKPFIYNDERLLDLIERQWEDMRSNKKTIQTKVFFFFFFFKKPIGEFLLSKIIFQSKIQTGIRAQTPQMATRSKRKIAPSSSSQVSKVRKIGMDHKPLVTK